MNQEDQTRAQNPAYQFLLLCLRGRFHGEALTEAARLASSGALDWDDIEGQIDRQKLAPLVYTIVRSRRLVPQGLEQRLRQAYHENAKRNLVLLNELSQVLLRLTETGVPAIVLKGAAMAEVVYENIAVRPMGDIDLLVQRRHASRALDLFSSLGYKRSSSEPHPDMALKYENEVVLHKSGHIEFYLEPHWSLLDSPYYQENLPMEWFWETARPASFDKAPALVLGPEGQLLHLCSHLMVHHRGAGLLWLHDIAEVLHHYQSVFDWDVVLRQAQAFHLVLSLQSVLPEVVELWEAPVPDSVLRRLNDLSPTPAESKTISRLTSAYRPVAQRFFADLAGIPGWQQRLRFAMQNLFPSPSYMRQRYVVRWSAMLPFYYVYRWLLGLFSVFRR